jgi:hypothetical protein
MPAFGAFLGAEDVADLRAYLLERRAALVAEEARGRDAAGAALRGFGIE